MKLSLTDEELAQIQFQERFYDALFFLGVNLTSLSLFRTMMIDSKPWSTSAMAKYKGMSWKGVRDVFERNYKLGFLDKTKDGWVVNDAGRAAFLAIHRQGMKIAANEIDGFTPELIRAFAYRGNARQARSARNFSRERKYPVFRML